MAKIGRKGGKPAARALWKSSHRPGRVSTIVDNALLGPFAVHSGKRSPTELPLSLSLHQSPSGPSGVGVFFNEIGGWFGFADRIVFATQPKWKPGRLLRGKNW